MALTSTQAADVLPVTGRIPAQTDWLALSKTVVIEIAFAASIAAVLTGHDNPDIVQLAWALGGTLGLLRITDVVANVVNIRSYLTKPPSAGQTVPTSSNTPLVTTNGVHGTDASS